MDNQHKLIKGYRDLSSDEISLMNRIKEAEIELLGLVREVKTIHRAQRTHSSEERLEQMDQAQPERWAQMAVTEFQAGFMFLIRAVAQPQSPNGSLT